MLPPFPPSLVSTASALGAPPPTAAPLPPRLSLLLAFPSLACRSPPSENRAVRVFKMGWSGRLPNPTTPPPPSVARAPSYPSSPSHIITSTSPLLHPPSLVHGRCCRTNLPGRGREEGRGKSRAYGRNQHGWVERLTQTGSAIEGGLTIGAVGVRSSRSLRLDTNGSVKRDRATTTEIRSWRKSVWLGCANFLPSRDKEQQRHRSAGKGRS